MRTLAWARSHSAVLLDLVIVACLAGTAEYEIWVAPLSDDGIPGPQLVNGLLFLAVGVGLLLRRRRPVAAFYVMFAAAFTLLAVGRVLPALPPTQTWLVGRVLLSAVAAYAP